MVDRQFADASLARLYDLFHPPEEREDFRFYLRLVMSATSVLDVGCGTGALLHAARRAGHAGRLCGLDPGAGMLTEARGHGGVDWVQGDLGACGWSDEFDLVVMTGHVFQVFVEDDELREALAAVRAALTDDGRFVFETRNPAVREWERWVPDNATEILDSDGAVVRMAHQLHTPVEGDRVSFTTTFTGSEWGRPKISRSALRFLDPAALSAFLTEAGLTVEERFGDWDRSPVTPSSPEVIISARRSAEAAAVLTPPVHPDVPA